MRFIRRLYRKISRIIAWLPILWETEEFDWEYLIDIMRFHMCRMWDHFDKRSPLVERQKKEAKSTLMDTIMAINTVKSSSGDDDRAWNEFIENFRKYCRRWWD
jgi:hypothetical protein